MLAYFRHVEHIKAVSPSENKRIFEENLQSGLVVVFSNRIACVCDTDLFMDRMMEHVRVELVV
jgi:hypothetical protein